ncbi:MAG: hypothetical protein A2919_00450 [Candidatus Spechtbacteria bacterium RIFCSPLOWO2_01_FULL_43_12]|uniref:Polymerase nucleotidyl transferase domain-containing protein n=1 Tax=Candidatus Spechtbacteria bacterium RIFCSPLOWO2_01_FULL_43_12 TaxID=1802162 RepID=A0A1G2HFA5_9BACT|nr:MAG: hypothetical protein A2919_00450 [Candidatus Spechtbacteria bacterium RIFCSPLOWO2_01_FULL_43_12]
METTKEEGVVLQTLAYYLAMADVALTPLEVKKYTLQKRDTLSLFEIHNALNSLKNKEAVVGKNGFWTIKTGEFSAQNRLEGTKNSAFKWKKFSTIASFIPYVPYVRGIAVTGSVALNNATPKSDIDILITTESGKIWTTRFLITVVSWVLGSRRYGQNITDRLCFNHYITSDSDGFGPPDINSVVQSINIPAWNIGGKPSAHLLRPLKPVLKLKNAVEYILDRSGIGLILERILGKAQITKIRNNSMKYPKELKTPALDSKQLIFYYPKVQDTENRYREIIKHI